MKQTIILLTLCIICTGLFAQDSINIKHKMFLDSMWRVSHELVENYEKSKKDSVKLIITRVKTTEDKKVYWLKDVNTKDRYITQCTCKTERKKGEIVMIARKDLVIIKEVFTKRDLEN